MSGVNASHAPLASLTSSDTGFHVQAYQKIEYTLDYVADAFDPRSSDLADIFVPHGRCLMVVDENVFALHGDRARAYFAHHDLDLTVVEVRIAETAKTLRTVEQIVDAFADFGLMRKEQVLVVGGGLTTDVAGFACAAYKRSTGYVRIPTTLIGLIDASVSIKVGANHGPHKNRLGAYHASSKVFLDFSMLRTLPIDQVRNGIAEIIKSPRSSTSASSSASRSTARSSSRRRSATPRAPSTCARSPDRSPTTRSARCLELGGAQPARARPRPGHRLRPHVEPHAGAAPQPGHYLHGHADQRGHGLGHPAEQRGYLTTTDRDRVLGLFSRLGLSVDSPWFTPELLERATASILATRDGMLRAAVPRPIGTCHFVSDVTVDELVAVLAEHRRVCAGLPRGGAGLDAFTTPEEAHVEVPARVPAPGDGVAIRDAG